MTKRILNCKRSRDTVRDWTLEHATAAGLVQAPAALPKEVDLREGWWRVANQHESGSCVGWAAADGVVRWHLVKAGKLDRDEPLSVRYLWMAAKETDVFDSFPSTFIEQEGTSLKAALDIVRKLGVVPDSVLPFDASGLFQGQPEAFFAQASERKISSYFNLDRADLAWRHWLFTQGPILVRLNVDRSFDEAGKDGTLLAYDPSSARGGHAVCIVGYRRDGSFIVRNSWGDGWGHGGFAYASEAYARAAFDEAYGVRLS